MPWWAVSFLVHLLVLFVLSHVEFGAVPPRKKRIEIRAELVEVVQRLRPVAKRNVFGDPADPSAAKRGSSLSALLRSSSRVVPMSAPGAVSMAAIDGLFGSGAGGSLDSVGWSGGGAKLTKVRKAAAKTYAEAIDDFAEEMIDALEEKPLLVALLFDESMSLKDDRHLIMAKLQSVKKALDENLDEDQGARLRWTVVSYGRHHRIWLRPSSKMDSVIEAIDRIKEDSSGDENLMSALRYCVSTYAKLKKPTFVVVITDEAGSDVDKSKYVEDTISALTRVKFRVYFFGRESVFGSRIGEEIPQDSDWTAPVQVDKGPDSPVPEFFECDDVFVASKNVPSGTAMYVQGRLAAATQGSCYLLQDKPSPYDDRLLEQMRPELCSRKEYDRRNRQSSIRRTLAFILKSWPEQCPSMNPRQSQIADSMRQAAKAQEFCVRAIRQLKKLRHKRGQACKVRPKRWQANFDLVYAELHKFRFMLRHYSLALQRGGTSAPSADGEGNKLVALRLALDTSAPIEDDEEFAQVRALFEQIEKDYKGTPWAVVAENERAALGAMTTVPVYEQKRGGGSDRGERKEPPKL